MISIVVEEAKRFIGFVKTKMKCNVKSEVIVFGIVLFSLITCIIVLGRLYMTSSHEKQHCRCVAYDCRCCVHLYQERKLDDTLCLDISYAVSRFEISTTLTYNGVSIFSEVVPEFKFKSHKSVHPTYAPCTASDDNGIRKDICIKLHSLRLEDYSFYGQAEFEVSVDGIIPLRKYKLGSFNCRANQASLLGYSRCPEKIHYVHVR